MSSFIPVAKQELETEVFVLSFALITLRMGTPQNDFGVVQVHAFSFTIEMLYFVNKWLLWLLSLLSLGLFPNCTCSFMNVGTNRHLLKLVLSDGKTLKL